MSKTQVTFISTVAFFCFDLHGRKVRFDKGRLNLTNQKEIRLLDSLIAENPLFRRTVERVDLEEAEAFVRKLQKEKNAGIPTVLTGGLTAGALFNAGQGEKDSQPDAPFISEESLALQEEHKQRQEKLGSVADIAEKEAAERGRDVPAVVSLEQKTMLVERIKPATLLPNQEPKKVFEEKLSKLGAADSSKTDKK